MSLLTCRDGADRLMDYLEGLLPAAERAAMDAHLGVCVRCVEFVRSYRATPRILRDATAVEITGKVETSLRRFLAVRRDRRQ
jgi:anti-sigma factor RsiW